jgi:RNA polymerase-binding transcription factor DksA
MAKAKKSSSAKRSATAASRAKSSAQKVQPGAARKIAKNTPSKGAPKAAKTIARGAKPTVKAPRPTAAAKKPATSVRVAAKNTPTKKAITSKPRITSKPESGTTYVAQTQKNDTKIIATQVVQAPPIAKRPAQQHSTMSNTIKNKMEVAPGGGIVQPATRTIPEMRLLPDDAEILASASERYGRKDLDAFRKLILEQVQEAREEFEILSQNILDTSGEFEADNQTYSLHTAEQGTDAIEREKTFLHAQRTSDFIKKLDEAIERIDRGTYGICVVCGGLIEKERLQAVPITQKHVDCKNRTQVRKPGSGNSGFRDEEPPPNVD